jgi:hypothetical protein
MEPKVLDVDFDGEHAPYPSLQRKALRTVLPSQQGPNLFLFSQFQPIGLSVWCDGQNLFAGHPLIRPARTKWRSVSRRLASSPERNAMLRIPFREPEPEISPINSTILRKLVL